MLFAAVLAELRALYKEIVPPSGNPELIETVGDVRKYLFYYLDTGTSQDAKPVAHKANKTLYVWKEGTGDEAAYYEDLGPIHDVDKNIVAVNPSAPTPVEIYRLYQSSLVRSKVQGLMVRAANDIYNELDTVPNHAQRLKWALDVMKDGANNINVMMAFVAMNALILGGAYVDEDLRFLVNSNIDKWAVTIYS